MCNSSAANTCCKGDDNVQCVVVDIEEMEREWSSGEYMVRKRTERRLCWYGCGNSGDNKTVIITRRERERRTFGGMRVP